MFIFERNETDANITYICREPNRRMLYALLYLFGLPSLLATFDWYFLRSNDILTVFLLVMFVPMGIFLVTDLIPYKVDCMRAYATGKKVSYVRSGKIFSREERIETVIEKI